MDIDRWKFEELDEAVQKFKEINKNPYVEEKIDDRFVIKKDEDQWEDLEYAEENSEFRRKTLIPKI